MERGVRPMQCACQSPSRRLVLWSSGALWIGGFASSRPAAATPGPKCPGKSGYELRKCLKELREAEGLGDARDEMLEVRQYEQPGTLVTLPSGVQYRELLEGTGQAAEVGRVCDILYTVYRLSSGGYYRYSGGGTPVLLYGLGYGYEGADDVGSTYRFTLGDRSAMPVAGTLGMVGMREGGRRRILVPPQLGWGSEEKIGPLPRSFGGRRRLANHNEDPLLLEVELRRVGEATEGQFVAAPEVVLDPFKLPAPPSPYKRLLGD